jgi:hypothetical protein
MSGVFFLRLPSLVIYCSASRLPHFGNYVFLKKQPSFFSEKWSQKKMNFFEEQASAFHNDSGFIRRLFSGAKQIFFSNPLELKSLVATFLKMIVAGESVFHYKSKSEIV